MCCCETADVPGVSIILQQLKDRPAVRRVFWTPARSMCHHVYVHVLTVLSFLDFKLCLSCDGSLVRFFWVSSFPFSTWFPAPRLFLHSCLGILRTWPKYFHLLFNIVDLIDSAFVHLRTSSLVMDLFHLMFSLEAQV